MARAVIAALAVVASHLSVASAHGAVVAPLTRNAADRFPLGPNLCICANATPGTAGASSTSGCANGQACYWYQQGCFIGCKECDHVSGRVQKDICRSGKEPTNNDPATCTVNRRNIGHPKLDIYKHNPWRAPGSAPVADSCGLAGGTPWGPNVPEAGDYVNTSVAHHGSFGSKVLPNSNARTVWKIGGEAEVIWQILANHGGGYQYRLCPADQKLSEDCFFKLPLPFNELKQAIQFNNGTRLPIKGTFLRNGTLPAGSTWVSRPAGHLFNFV